MAKKKRAVRKKKKVEPEVEPEEIDESPDDEGDERAEAKTAKNEPGESAESPTLEIVSEDSAAEEEPPEPEIDQELADAEAADPDNQDAVVALRDVGARVDLSEKTGRVWRIFFYDRMDDRDLAQIHGLPCLREVWLLGSKVSKEAADKLQEGLPKAKIYI